MSMFIYFINTAFLTGFFLSHAKALHSNCLGRR